MTKEQFEKLKILASKKRLESANRYLMTDKEKKEFEDITKEYELMDNSIPKAIFYMHDFLGIRHKEIARILNFSYITVRMYYALAKDIIVD